jgi:hypothetical protein
VKIKHAPIELVWNLREGSPQGSASTPAKQRTPSESNRRFRPPPKVRIVPGILGSCHVEETRDAHPFQEPGGVRKEGGVTITITGNGIWGRNQQEQGLDWTERGRSPRDDRISIEFC